MTTIESLLNLFVSLFGDLVSFDIYFYLITLILVISLASYVMRKVVFKRG